MKKAKTKAKSKATATKKKKVTKSARVTKAKLKKLLGGMATIPRSCVTSNPRNYPGPLNFLTYSSSPGSRFSGSRFSSSSSSGSGGSRQRAGCGRSI